MNTTNSVKLKVQSMGRFLSNMVMPNIGAFIAWGLITALFIPTGWLPNEQLANMVGPMIKYLLPLLIGYTGGKIVGGERGAVVGAVTTVGVIVGTDIPMFIGAMIAGPLGGLAIKKVDAFLHGKIKQGFEMLVNNFSAGIVGLICAVLAYKIIGPSVSYLSDLLAAGVNFLVQHNALPLTSIFVEPAKILFLNNAINHGIFTPLGAAQSEEFGQSFFFLIEANPGPGLGVLLAYTFFGRGSAKESAPGAAIIHFFGGIHEIYFPYILMSPRLILAVIAGGMCGVFTLVLFNAGLVSAASPGSIIAVMLMTPPGSVVGVLAAVAIATAVSFVCAAFLLKTQSADTQDLDKATEAMQSMKAQSKNISTDQAKTVRQIMVACDAGMGSSAMGAGLLRKKIEKAQLPIEVTHSAINSLPESVDIVITHQDLTDRARKQVPNAQHLSLNNFLDHGLYDQLIATLVESQTTDTAAPAQDQQTPAAAPEVPEETEEQTFTLSEQNIFLGMTSQPKEDIIRYIGEQLVAQDYAETPYIEGMLDREQLVSTYLGESIAVPHGTQEVKQHVKKTGIIFAQFPEGVQWGDDDDDIAHIVIGIAAQGDEHIKVLSSITNALDDDAVVERLQQTTDKTEVLNILKGSNS